MARQYEPGFSGSSSSTQRTPTRSSTPRTAKKKATPKRPDDSTPAALKHTYRRIVSTDSQFRKAADTALRGGGTLLSDAFKVLDTGRKPVQKLVLGKTTEQIGKTGWSVKDMPKWTRGGLIGMGYGLAEKVGGGKAVIAPNVKGVDRSDLGRFGLDVALTPSTYVTGGAGGAGRQTAKLAIGKKVAAAAGESAAAKVTAPIVRKSLVRGVEKSRPATVSTMLRRASQEGGEVARAARQAKVGGLRIASPIGDKSITLLPGTVTSRITSPVARTLSRVSPVQPGRRMGWESGLEGALTRIEGLQTRQLARNMSRQGSEATAKAAQVFGRSKEQRQRFERVFIGAEPPKTNREAKALAGVKTFLSDVEKEVAKRPNLKMGHIDDYFPLYLSQETLAKTGRGVAPKFPSGANSAKFHERIATKGLKGTTADMNEYMRKNGHPDVKEFFSEDFYKNLHTYANKSALKITGHDQAENMLEKGTLRHSLARTRNDLDVNTLTRAGFKSPDEAVAAMVRRTDTATPPNPALGRLAEIDEDQYAALQQVARDKTEAAQAAARTKAEAQQPALNRLEYKYDREANRIRALEARQPKAHVVPADLRRRIARDEARVELINQEIGERTFDPKHLEMLKKVSTRLSQNKAKAENVTRTSLATSGKVVAAEKKQVPLLRKQLDEVGGQLERRQDTVEQLLDGLDPKTGDPWPVTAEAIEREMTTADWKQGWAKIEGTSIPALNGKYAPKAIVEEMRESITPQNVGKFLEGFEKLQGVWRRNVTAVFPMFHTRNAMGGAFSNWIGGVRLRHYEQAERILANHIGDGAKVWRRYGGRTTAQLREELAGLGVGIKGATTQAGEFTTAGAAAQAKTRLGKGLHKYWVDPLSSGVENRLRTAAYLKGLEKFGNDSDVAAAFMYVRHGDYSDLTTTDRYARIAFPFYKWLRTNIPFQLQAMVEKPGRYQKYHRFFENLKDPAEGDRFQNPANAYAERRGALSIPGTNRTFFPDLPLADLNDFNVSGLLGQTSVSGPIEFAQGKSLRTEANLDKMIIPGKLEKAMVMPFKNVPSMEQYFGVSRGGEMTVNARLLRLLQTMNPASRYISTGQGLADEQSRSPGFEKEPLSTNERIANFLGAKTQVNRPDINRHVVANKFDDIIRKRIYPQGYAEDFRGTVRRKARKKKENIYI